MSYRTFALGMTLAAAALIGCDPADDTTPDTPPQTTPAASPEAQALDQARAVTGQAEQRAGEAAQQAGEAAEATTAEAQKLLEQATQYINENKWDLAEKTIAQLEGMKASLPGALQTQVDNARKLLETRRAAGNVGGAVEGLIGN